MSNPADAFDELRKYIDRAKLEVFVACSKCHRPNRLVVDFKTIPTHPLVASPPEALRVECEHCKEEIVRLFVYPY